MATRHGRVTGSRRSKAYREAERKRLSAIQRRDRVAVSQGFLDSLERRRIVGTKSYQGYLRRFDRSGGNRKNLTNAQRKVITREWKSHHRRTHMDREHRHMEWLKLIGVIDEDATLADYREYIAA